MPMLELKDLDKHYVVICFVHENDLATHQKKIEALGNQRNVSMVVQPCPYEGIEFLYRIDQDLLAHISEYDESMLWKVLVLSGQVGADVLKKIVDSYHAYFCAVLEQDGDKVANEVKKLDGFRGHFDFKDE